MKLLKTTVVKQNNNVVQLLKPPQLVDATTSRKLIQIMHSKLGCTAIFNEIGCLEHLTGDEIQKNCSFLVWP